MAENTGTPGGYVGPAHPAVAEVERLRVLVQALEEECAARQEDGDGMAAALSTLVSEALSGTPVSVQAIRAGERAEAAHDALTARYAPGAPDPLPDPVEGDSGQAAAESDPIRAAGERLAALLTMWATPDTDPEALAEAKRALTAWDDALGVPADERCPIGTAEGTVTVRCTDSWAQFGERR